MQKLSFKPGFTLNQTNLGIHLGYETVKFGKLLEEQGLKADRYPSAKAVQLDLAQIIVYIDNSKEARWSILAQTYLEDTLKLGHPEIKAEFIFQRYLRACKIQQKEAIKNPWKISSSYRHFQQAFYAHQHNKEVMNLFANKMTGQEFNEFFKTAYKFEFKESLSLSTFIEKIILDTQIQQKYLSLNSIENKTKTLL